MMTPITIQGFRLWQRSDFSWTAQVNAPPEDFTQDYQGEGETPMHALGALIAQLADDRKVVITATYYPQRTTHNWPMHTDYRAPQEHT